MKKNAKTLLAAVVFSAGLLSATGANAALTSALGGQVVNDTDLSWPTPTSPPVIPLA